MYKKNAKRDVRLSSIAQMKQALDQLQKEMQNSKRWIPHCIKIGQLLFQMGPSPLSRVQISC